MNAKEIAEDLLRFRETPAEETDPPYVILAKAHLSQADKIQGLVEALEKIAKPEKASVGHCMGIAQQALTAYKEGKNDGT